MGNLLAGSTDTPLNAKKRGQSFWRYQKILPALVTDGATAPYIPLGGVVPAAIQVGPTSFIDSYRVWSLPPGTPQVPVYQDVSVRSPAVSPIPFCPTPSTPTGGTAVDPQLYVYLGVNELCYNAPFAGVAGQYPLAPRWFAPPAPSTPIQVDLIVYFTPPVVLPFARAPLNNAYMAGIVSAGNAQNAARHITTLAGFGSLFYVPTYGRNHLKFSLKTSAILAYQLAGVNYCVDSAGNAYQETRIIQAASTVANIGEAYNLALSGFDYVFLVSTQAGTVASVEYSFEATDD